MIKKIRVLKQYGVFSHFDQGADLELGKATVIYGLNTYGKSTLCDLFKSLGAGNSEIITKRRTIPYQENKPQQIVLSVAENQEKERALSFNNSRWSDDSLKDRVAVFDTEFVHRNIFDGISLLESRETKENFTDFIIGDDSVGMARELETRKRALAEKKRDLDKLIPQYVRGKNNENVMAFINLQVDSEIAAIEEELHQARSQLNEFERGMREQAKVLQLEEPVNLKSPDFTTVNEAVEKCNNLLETGFDSISNQALGRVQDHIKYHFDTYPEAEVWLKTGVAHIQKQECPFCGQSLHSVQELLTAYHEFFSEEYVSFCANMDHQLQVALRNVTMNRELGEMLTENLLAIEAYSKWTTSERLNTLTDALRVALVALNDVETRIVDQIEIVREELGKKIAEKKNAPYQSILGVKSEFKELLDELSNLIDRINVDIDECKVHIAEFKEPYKSDSVDEEIKQVKLKIQALEMQQQRVKQEESCQEYIRVLGEIELEQDAITNLDEELERTEEAFLDRYFCQIESIFSKLGSSQFRLKRSSSGRGYKKVHGIQVFYKETKISSSDIERVFSESDRRALALAVFLAKLAMLDEDEKKDKIVVLDDPVTSFDENRMIQLCKLLLGLRQKFAQVILLSHYPNLLREIWERFGEVYDGCTFIRISQNHETSFLERLDIDKFLLSEDEKAFLKIMDFINKRSHEDIRTDLRIFLENRLRTLYYNAYVEHDLFKLDFKKRIERLNEFGYIDEQTTETLQEYRSILNPDHHMYSSNNLEDIRLLAVDLMRFLFSQRFSIAEPSVSAVL